MISVVINTCAGSRNPAVLACRGSFNNTAKHPYAARAEKLREVIKRYVAKPWELIIVGEWEPGDGYTYIESPGPNNDPTDQVPQRHAGALAATGDYVVFLNDDHFATGLEFLPADMEGLDVGSFKRFAVGAGNTVRVLDTGWPDYVMGHACVMTKEALQKVPWGDVWTVHQCDVAHSSLCKGAGLRIGQLEHAVVWDIEEGSLP